MTTVPPSQRQQRHSSPDLTQLMNPNHHQNQRRAYASPEAASTSPTHVPTNSVAIPGSKPNTAPASHSTTLRNPPPIDTSVRTHLYNENSLRAPLASVPDQLESPTTPTSAGNSLRVHGVFSSSNSHTGAIPIRGSSVLSTSNSFEFSPGSYTSSPGMEHIPRMTPLPSPIVYGGSPGPWNRMRSRSVSRPPSRSSLSVHHHGESMFGTSSGEHLA